MMAAVESLARTIAIYQRAETKTALKREYRKVRDTNPIELIEDYICPRIGKTPSKLLGRNNWIKLKFANKYRNFLIHECAFLRQGISKELIKVSKNTFKKLKKLIR